MTDRPPKLLLVHLDGIDWASLVARVRAGSLPAIAGLMARGACGRLLSNVPVASPAALATLMTGQPPQAHGIITGWEPWAGGLRPAGRTAWCVDPLWLRLADAGFVTSSIGLPTMRPGAAWPGNHIDDRLALPDGRSWQTWSLPRDVAPPDLREDLRDLRVHPTDITSEMLRPLVPAMSGIDQEQDHRLVDLALALARLTTNDAAAQALLTERPWDAAFVHHDWLSQVGHRFTGASGPYEGVVDAAWTMVDAVMAGLDAICSADTMLMMVSLGRTGNAGTIVARGPSITPRSSLAQMRSMDLAPTVLAWFGLADENLPGKAQLGGSALRAAPPPRERMPPAPPSAPDIARVTTFGLTPPAADTDTAAHTLAARAELLMASDPTEAGRLAEEALAAGPDAILPLGLLAAARVATGQANDLPALADRLAAIIPDHPWEALIRAGYHAIRKEASQAAPYLQRAGQARDCDVRLRAAAGWLMLKRPDEAKRLLEPLHAEQPDRTDILVGLAMAAASRPLEAERWLRRALILDPINPIARVALNDLLTATGRSREVVGS